MKKLQEFKANHPKAVKTAKTVALVGVGIGVGVGGYLMYNHFFGEEGGCAPTNAPDASTDASKALYAPCAF